MEFYDLVAGIFKFAGVDEMEVVALAQEWAKDHRFLRVSVRACGEDMIGIDFVYAFEGNSAKKATHALGRKLRRRFGEDRVVGWDTSSPVWLLK